MHVNDFLKKENREALAEEHTKEGLFELTKETIRGNEYNVFLSAPQTLQDYFQFATIHGEWNFLEYEDEIVRVSDIFQTKKDNEWSLNVSSYNKLRLKKDWVSNVLVLNSMNIVNDFERDGMLFLHAKKL